MSFLESGCRASILYCSECSNLVQPLHRKASSQAVGLLPGDPVLSADGAKSVVAQRQFGEFHWVHLHGFMSRLKVDANLRQTHNPCVTLRHIASLWSNVWDTNGSGVHQRGHWGRPLSTLTTTKHAWWVMIHMQWQIKKKSYISPHTAKNDYSLQSIQQNIHPWSAVWCTFCTKPHVCTLSSQSPLTFCHSHLRPNQCQDVSLLKCSRFVSSRWVLMSLHDICRSSSWFLAI